VCPRDHICTIDYGSLNVIVRRLIDFPEACGRVTSVGLTGGTIAYDSRPKHEDVPMRIENDAGLSALLTSEAETKLCTGFAFTEGPIWIASDDALLFSDIPASIIHRWRVGATTAEVYRTPSGNSNGLTVDPDGHLLACEHSGRRVSRAPYIADAPDGYGQGVTAGFEGKRFNSPNDLVWHSSGSIFFTDPTCGLTQPGETPPPGQGQYAELDFQGVYRVDPEGTLTLLTDEFTQPNGLAFSPDESQLYIGDSRDSIIRRYDVTSDGTLTGGVPFADQRGDVREGVPDGMKVDESGRLWATGAGGVSVFEPDGRCLGQVETEEHAANLTFGGPAFSTLFLTAGTSVYSLETAVRGVAPGSR
jgi:gluconolactonase